MPVAVYNLTVEGESEYYANGVLVHNCWDLASGRKRGEEPVKLNDHGMDQVRYVVAHVDLRPRRGAPAAGGTRPAFQAPLGGQVPGPYYGG
jgi:hypothetical protein